MTVEAPSGIDQAEVTSPAVPQAVSAEQPRYNADQLQQADVILNEQYKQRSNENTLAANVEVPYAREQQPTVEELKSQLQSLAKEGKKDEPREATQLRLEKMRSLREMIEDAELLEEMKELDHSDAEYLKEIESKKNLELTEIVNAATPITSELAEALKAMEAFRQQNLEKAFAKLIWLSNALKKDKKMEHLKIRRISKNKLTPDAVDIHRIDLLRLDEEQKEKEIAELEKSNPEAFYALNLLKLREYARQIRTGRLVETPYVKKAIEEQLENLELGNVSFLYGDTGSGKTELARIIAKRFYERFEKDPEKRRDYSTILVRGYPGMTSEELMGHQELKVSNAMRAAELPNRVEAEVESYMQSNPGATEEQKVEAQRLITERLLRENSATYSEFMIGAVYKAAQDGKVLIIDEANYIPPGLLAKINDILTKRPGEFINVQEDGVEPIKVREGFGVLMTGNMNVKATAEQFYKDRKDLDPALRDRIVLRPYDYLPQRTTGSFYESPNPEENQLFMIALCSLIDTDGSLRAPENAVDDIWRLSKLARLTEEAFAGRFTDGNKFEQGASSIQIQVKKLISPRGLQAIIQEWQKSNYAYEIDHYIYKYLIQNNENIKERAYFYQLASRVGFFQSEGWPKQDEVDYGKDGAIANFLVKDPENKMADKAKQFYSPMDTVEAIYGNPPARTEWPTEEAKTVSEQGEKAAEFAALQERFDQLKEEVAKWAEKIGDVCPIPEKEA